MGKYVVKRLLQMILVLLGVTIAVYTILYLTPGDPVTIIAGGKATEAQREAIRIKFGLDKPYVVQLWNYIKNLVFHGNFGMSYTTSRDVSEKLFAAFPITLKVSLISVIICVIVGVFAGIVSAIRQYSFFDIVCQTISFAGVSIPSFWLALLLVLGLAVKVPWFPSSGLDGWRSYVLPCVALGMSSAAMITRMTRSSMLDVIRQDYIRTARAKGQKEWIITCKHALKNALIPIITVVGLQFGGLLGGCVATETIFAINGIGKLSVEAINTRDYPVVLGCVLIVSLMFSLINLAVDLLYTYVDPRIRSQYTRKRSKSEAAETLKAASVAAGNGGQNNDEN